MPKIQISKSIKICKDIQEVFSVVNDFKQWVHWSPWLMSEPDCKLQYSEDGSSYNWDGKIIGAGSMAKTGSSGMSKLHMKLEFVKPWKSTSTVSFEFSELEAGTKVTWTMIGSLPFFLFFISKKMEAGIGMDYERGLKMLKDYCEIGEVKSQLVFIGNKQFIGKNSVAIRRNSTIAEIGKDMDRDIRALENLVGANHLVKSDVPFSVYEKWDMVKQDITYVIGQPVEELSKDLLKQEFFEYRIPDCEIFEIEHTGPFDHLGNAWSAGYMRVQAKTIQNNKSIMPFERYCKFSEGMDKNEYVTKVCFPLR